MAENIILYGPPGTGKTYRLQRMMDDYIDYIISDDAIRDAFANRSDPWLLLAAILFQNQHRMTPVMIQEKIDQLGINPNFNVSTILELHDIAPSPVGLERQLPRVFFEVELNEWYVDRTRLLNQVPNFFRELVRETTQVNRFNFISFHQSYSYEDFIEGIRPRVVNETNQLDYSVRPGVFLKICNDALRFPEKQYAIFIDEINRGNVSEIFGELISLIEVDKRIGQKNELSATLPYSNMEIKLPDNLNVYGSMNTADRSIALVDIALRRRFDFIPIKPDWTVIKTEYELKGLDATDIDGINIINLFVTINKRISILLDDEHMIGHSYFLGLDSLDAIGNMFKVKLIPLLEDYFFSDKKKIQLVLNDLSQDGDLRDNALYKHETLIAEELFAYYEDYQLDDKEEFYFNDGYTVESFKKIYEW